MLEKQLSLNLEWFWLNLDLIELC